VLGVLGSGIKSFVFKVLAFTVFYLGFRFKVSGLGL
jgi:hypothetical protein